MPMPMAMPPVHEDVHQGASEQDEVRECAPEVRLVFLIQQEAADAPRHREGHPG